MGVHLKAKKQQLDFDIIYLDSLYFGVWKSFKTSQK